MNLYDFIGDREECHKMTSSKMNAVTLVSAFSLLENIGDRAEEVRMNQTLFSQFVCNAFTDAVQNSVYERTVRTMTFMNAAIVIDNSIADSIVVVRGGKDDGMSVVKIFIEQ